MLSSLLKEKGGACRKRALSCNRKVLREVFGSSFLMRVFDLVRCLLNGFWLPHDPRTALDVFKSTRQAGRAPDGREDWAGQYIYCNGWDLALSMDRHRYYPVVVPYRPNQQAWLMQDQIKSLGWEGVVQVGLLMVLCSNGMQLLALFCAIALLTLKPK